MDKDEIKSDLDTLERKIEQLKVEYEKFFVGIVTVEPVPLRNQISQLVKKYATSANQIRNVMLSFKYRNLVARFLTYQEYWNRILRLIEDGKNPKDYRKLMEAFREETKTQTTAQKKDEQKAAEDRYAALYREYGVLAQKSGKRLPGIEAFRKTIQQYENTIKEKYGPDAEAVFTFEESEKGIKIKTRIRKSK